MFFSATIINICRLRRLLVAKSDKLYCVDITLIALESGLRGFISISRSIPNYIHWHSIIFLKHFLPIIIIILPMLCPYINSSFLFNYYYFFFIRTTKKQMRRILILIRRRLLIIFFFSSSSSLSIFFYYYYYYLAN